MDGFNDDFDEVFKQFQSSVSEVTLHDFPKGLWEDILINSETSIIVAPTPKKFKPWLDISALEELYWSRQIKKAHLLSDHLQDSRMLYEIPHAQELEITLLGSNFEESDYSDFWTAILNLQELKKLNIKYTSATPEKYQSYFNWPFKNIDVIIETTKLHRRGLRKPS